MKKDDGRIVIIKKKKVVGGGGHHGGSWKVAYADFITALFALFLILWILASMSVQGKKDVGQYFRSYSIFKGNEVGGGKGIAFLSGGTNFIEPSVMTDDTTSKLKMFELNKTARENLNISMVSKLEESVKEKLNLEQDQVIIFSTNDGVRIELVEKNDHPMFESGRAALLDTGKNIIAAISPIIREIPNKIEIEGHTDAFIYSSEEYTNWELSSDRANAARRQLLKNGIPAERIAKVTSFADALPFNGDKYSPNNRRVSILIENPIDEEGLSSLEKYNTNNSN